MTGFADHLATLREGIVAALPSEWPEHHDRCSSRKGEDCDCWHRRYKPQIDALVSLDALAAGVWLEREEAGRIQHALVVNVPEEEVYDCVELLQWRGLGHESDTG